MCPVGQDSPVQCTGNPYDGTSSNLLGPQSHGNSQAFASAEGNVQLEERKAEASTSRETAASEWNSAQPTDFLHHSTPLKKRRSRRRSDSLSIIVSNSFTLPFNHSRRHHRSPAIHSRQWRFNRNAGYCDVYYKNPFQPQFPFLNFFHSSFMHKIFESYEISRDQVRVLVTSRSFPFVYRDTSLFTYEPNLEKELTIKITDGNLVDSPHTHLSHLRAAGTPS
jgi:hypothetical protein